MARAFLTPFLSARNGDPFLSLHRDINRLFDEALRGPAPAAAADQGGNFVPAQINVAETEDEYRVTAELPGLSGDDVEVLLDDDLLTIRGEKRFERRDDKENYHLVECAYGTVQRSLRLPAAVDPQQVQATFENGLLRITLPKSKAQERARRIQVQAAAGAQAGRLAPDGRKPNGNGDGDAGSPGSPGRQDAGSAPPPAS
ncbi:MAG: type effector protein [Phenylobacterium sp.]|nr:type effector protein [Phenylobacterium sp.]